MVPADKKWWRDYVISKALVDALEGLDLRFPAPPQGLDGVVVK